MYRFLFRPIWLVFHVVVVAAVVLMVALGFWQLDRLTERQDFNAAVTERAAQTPRELSAVLDDLASGVLDESSAEWLPVTVSGTFLPDQLVEFNVSQGGRAGENVLSALAVDSSQITVIINRGFITLGSPLPAAPATAVDVVGYVRPSESRDRGGLTDTETGEPLTEVRRIDIQRIAQQLDGDVAPVYVQLIASTPTLGPGDPQPVVLPQLDNGPHLSYAVQWFIFALCVAAGWVLAVRRSLAQRRREISRADDGAAEAEAPEPEVVDSI